MDGRKEKSFEENLNRLEEIVSILEDGKISLEESVKLFEEGMDLMKECSKRLDSIENKISVLIQEDGRIKEEPFTNLNGDE